MADIALRPPRRTTPTSVLEVNRRAYQLYRRLGFTEVSRDGIAPEIRIRMVAGSKP